MIECLKNPRMSVISVLLKVTSVHWPQWPPITPPPHFLPPVLQVPVGTVKVWTVKVSQEHGKERHDKPSVHCKISLNTVGHFRVQKIRLVLHIFC